MITLDLSSVLPIAILVITGIVCMLMGTARRTTAAAWCSTICLIGLAAAAAAVSFRQPIGVLTYSGSLSVDPFAGYFQLLFLAIVALVGLGSREYVWREAMPSGEYYALLLFAASGMCLMAAANDLMVIFIGLEISSLASYVLVGLRRADAQSSESSLKYFLLGSFATAFFLYGVALLYGVTGSTQISAIRAHLYGGQNSIPAALQAHATGGGALIPAQFSMSGSMDLLLGASIALLFVGLAFKISAAPFQAWTPDVYQGAPAPVTALLSTAPKAAAFAAFLRIFLVGLGASAALWMQAMWVVAALTMTVGNFAALRQTNVKRVLAYSSIAHAGYMLIAFTAATEEAASAILFYLAGYAFMNVGAFLLISHIGGARELRTELSDYSGLAYRAPAAAACLTVFVLSLIGIPLTAGFLGKFYVFRSALQADLLGLTIIGALNSAVAAYYYLRILVAMYMSQPADDAQVAPPMPTGLRTVVGICLLATLLVGVYPHAVMRLAAQAAHWIAR
jgi:NADH-quinone oxidoreductase subunit N